MRVLKETGVGHRACSGGPTRLLPYVKDNER